MLVAVCAALAATMLGAESARAKEVQYRNGSPGWVSARTSAASSDTSDIFGAATQEATIGFGNLSLWSSRATSQTRVVTVTERVWGNYLLNRYVEGTSTKSYYVQSGRWNTVATASAPAVQFAPASYMFFFVQATITWRTTSGAYLGRLIVNYRSLGDLTCVTASCAYHDGGATTDSGYTFPTGQ